MVMIVHQCFAINFKHGTGIVHINPNHGPLSDKSDPLLNLLATALQVPIKIHSRSVLIPSSDSDAPLCWS